MTVWTVERMAPSARRGPYGLRPTTDGVREDITLLHMDEACLQKIADALNAKEIFREGQNTISPARTERTGGKCLDGCNPRVEIAVGPGT